MKPICKIALLIALTLNLACTPKNKFQIEAIEKQNTATHQIVRFDQDLYNIDITKLPTEVEALNQKYQYFMPYYTQGIMNIGPIGTSEANYDMYRFLTDSVFHRLYTDVEKKYTNVSDIELRLSKAFAYINHYFPEIYIPEVYMHVSGFNQSIVITDSVVSISIDNYMGSDYDFYKDVTYEYQRPFMIREKIVSDVLYVWLYSTFYDDKVLLSSLLNEMIYAGKIMYLLEVIDKNDSESMLIGFTDDQLKWCKNNEGNMYRYIVENKQLFSTDARMISKYMSEAPFTAYFPNESPGRTGIWLGWQIVKSYMENNSSVTLTDLLSNTNYQQILEDSNYRP